MITRINKLTTCLLFAVVGCCFAMNVDKTDDVEAGDLICLPFAPGIKDISKEQLQKMPVSDVVNQLEGVTLPSGDSVALVNGIDGKYSLPNGEDVGSVWNMKNLIEMVHKGQLGQIAGFVGRMESKNPKCDDQNHVAFYTGTGTLIQWFDMPEGLKGRVVLTVRHLHPEAWYTMELLRPTNDIAMNTHVHNITNNTMESLSQWLYFTPDPGSEINTRQRGPDKGSIPVVACFLPPKLPTTTVWPKDNELTKEQEEQMQNEVAEGNNYYTNDIMICVLKEPVFYCGTRLDGAVINTKELVSLNEIDKYISIGYGRPEGKFIPANSSDRVKYLAGWNTKKATHLYNLLENNDFTVGYIYRFATRAGDSQEGRINGTDFTGPSDSGAPVIRITDYCICGVSPSVYRVNLAPNIGWIVTAVEYYGNMIAKKD